MDRTRVVEQLPGLRRYARGLTADASPLNDALDLQRLPAEQRAMLRVTLEDLSYEETARILVIPVGTLMLRLTRPALQALAKAV